MLLLTAAAPAAPAAQVVLLLILALSVWQTRAAMRVDKRSQRRGGHVAAVSAYVEHEQVNL